MANGEGSGTKIGPGTWINLGMLIMLVGGAIKLTAFLTEMSGGFTQANKTLQSMDDRLSNVEKGVVNLQIVTGDRWTGTDMKLWASDFQRLNPAVIVPVPAHEQR